MRKKIYSKFSNDRSAEFSITTELVSKCNRIEVEKKAVQVDGMEHLRKQASYYSHYKDIYTKYGLELAPCSMKGDCLTYKYIYGDNFGEYISLIYKNEKDSAVKIVNEFCMTIRNLYYQESAWKYTEQFDKVFGKHEYEMLEDKQACTYINIDIIPDNVIMCHDKKYIIDYEWIFEFPVPIDFVIYRIIMSVTPVGDESFRNILFKSNNIDDTSARTYFQMEESFQKYILNGKCTVPDFYSSIGKKIYNISDYTQNIEVVKQKHSIEFFYDLGYGFSENQKCSYFEIAGKYKVNIPEGTKRVRIDPCSEACILNAISIDGKYIEGKELETLENNGIVVNEKLYFITDDPQIIVSVQNTKEICIGIELEDNNENDKDEFIHEYSFSQKKLMREVEKLAKLSDESKLKMNVEHIECLENEGFIKGGGWAFGIDIPIDKIYTFNSVEINNAMCGLERNDVAQAYPDCTHALYSGFMFQINDIKCKNLYLLFYQNGTLSYVKKIVT